jgi:hypothetical protein
LIGSLAAYGFVQAGLEPDAPFADKSNRLVRLRRRRPAQRRRGLIGRLRHLYAHVGQPYADPAGGIFHVFLQQQARRGPAGPPRLVAPPVADHENESWLEGALKSPAGAV